MKIYLIMLGVAIVCRFVMLIDTKVYIDKYYKEMPINFYIPSSYYDNSLKSGNILSSNELIKSV